MTGSTLKRPAAHLLRPGIDPQMRRDTVRTYLRNGWSLAICCCDCPRLVEWTPADLARRFASTLDVSIADIAERLTCKGEGGCGSSEVALFPHPFDGVWSWADDA